MRRITWLGFILFLAGAALAPSGEGDHPATPALWTDKSEYRRLEAGGPSEVIIHFRNDGPETVYLPSTSPYLVRDAWGHTVWIPSAAIRFVPVAPGETVVRTWAFTSHESLEDASAHPSPAQAVLALSGQAAEGEYVIGWSYATADGQGHLLQTRIRLHEGGAFA